MNISKLSCSILFILGVLSGCSVSAPDYKQQQELSARGSFAGGTPAWVLHPRSNGVADVATPQQGLMPTSFTSSGIGRDVRESQRMSTELPAVTMAERKALESGGKKPAEPEAVGMLNKLVAKCPYIEDQVRATLLVEDTQGRIKSWTELISQCPSGSALYFWIGQDYEKAGRLAEAGRNYEQALTLDHLNVDAAAALDELRKKQQPQ